ncbi:hypothetical protein B0H15DRAFT_944272 [Mycena belliarum]|uniref:Uncharacterized protein n=1 Tax=Mycena belliarum TaxID=1033014 RepID=A0AAD6UJF7_9AGAR|nr:hypothetical protein B0H15DRAFT_944272 [Mycena belliae]
MPSVWYPLAQTAPRLTPMLSTPAPTRLQTALRSRLRPPPAASRIRPAPARSIVRARYAPLCHQQHPVALSAASQPSKDTTNPYTAPPVHLPCAPAALDAAVADTDPGSAVRLMACTQQWQTVVRSEQRSAPSTAPAASDAPDPLPALPVRAAPVSVSAAATSPAVRCVASTAVAAKRPRVFFSASVSPAAASLAPNANDSEQLASRSLVAVPPFLPPPHARKLVPRVESGAGRRVAPAPPVALSERNTTSPALAPAPRARPLRPARLAPALSPPLQSARTPVLRLHIAVYAGRAHLELADQRAVG